MQSELILKTYGLAANPDLEALSFESEEDWHKLRQKGIGGSDIGAIMGLNKYSSPLQVYKSKTEGFVKDLSDNVNVRKGKDLESLIRTLYVAPYFLQLGYKVQNLSHHSIVNKTYPWLRANLDGIAQCIEAPMDYSKHFVIEIKFVSQWAEENWNGEEYCGVPPSYYAQVQEYMLVTGMRKAYVCAMFESTWECKFYEVPFNAVFVAKLIKDSKDFYDINMMMKIPPRVTIGIDKEDIIKKIEESKEIKETIPDASLNDKVVEYKSLGVQIKDLSKQQDAIKSEIVDAYLKGHIPTSPLLKVSVTSYTSERMDTAKFKEEQPGLYKQYCKESESIKVTIK